MAKIISSLPGSTGILSRTSQLTNDGESGVSTYVELDDISTVATTGDYNNLINVPVDFTPKVHTHNISDISGTKSEFNTSLTDGDFLFEGDITQYTDELAQDAVGSILTETATIDFTYDDITPTVSANVKLNSIDATHLADGINITEFTNNANYETTSQLNIRDTNNRNRVNHTGEQPISTVTGLQTNLDLKQDALGFTPENVANKANDFTTVNNTLYPTTKAVKSQMDLKQNTLNWKTPQDYGAVGNGIADDTAAINACLSANSNVLLFGTYKISSTINIQSNQFIFSNNCTISSVATGFVFLKADNINNWGISGKLKVTGSGYSDSTSKALNVIGGYNYSVNGMIIGEIDGWGILVENGVSNGTRGQRGTFSNIYINNCWTGIETGLLQEYTTLESIKVTGCNHGCVFQGGNTNLLNSNINDNINGVYIGDTVSTNNGHGIISNTNMNHNSGWNMRLSNVEYGQTIVGCHFYGTSTRNIEITDSYGISFDSCIIDGNVSNVDTHNPKGVHIISNSLIEPYTNFTGQKIYLRSCFTRTDSQYQTSLYDDGTKVGIGGTITPTANLEVIDSNQTASGDGNVTIRTTDSQAADKGGLLTFGGSYSGTSRTVFGGISGRKENSTNGNIAGYLSLYSSNPTIGLVEAARINSNGTTDFNYSVTAPTAPAGTNTTQIATTAFVLANAGVTSTGTTNRIPKFTSSNSLGDSGLIQVGGNIGMGSAVVPGELFHIGDGNILLEGGGEVAQKFKRDFTTTGENLGVPTGSGISVNPIFQVGRIIQAGDGDPEIRIMYSDDNTSERTVFEVDRKGIAASVKTSIGSHFEGFASLTDVNPKFRLNSYPRMRLEMGAGGNDITDVAVERGATGSLDFFTNSAYRGGFDSSGNLNLLNTPTAPTAPAGTNTTQIATTAFVLENSSARPYKVYTALLSQSGKNAPVATVLENNLGGAVVWTRTSAGVYYATLAGSFTINKTFVSSSNRYIGFTPIYRLDSNIISLATSVTGSTYVDNVLENNSIEIRVYN